jgi:hypothetical protein
MDAKTAVQYLKKMVFPYLSHDQKMITGQFFYEAEMMEKDQIMLAHLKGYMNIEGNKTEEQYYNETYGKSNS